MMCKLILVTLLSLAISMLLSPAIAADGNAARGQQVFRARAACHTLEPDRHMTGPSLANPWGRRAGGLARFPRYSSALQSSGIVWNDAILNEWIRDPQHLVPGNDMTFNGVKHSKERADLLAFLKDATQFGHAPQRMGGMMMGGGDLNLKHVGPEKRVCAITYCRETFRVTTADGHTRPFWERNLRLMVDSGEKGPDSGAPALVPAGMMGDRADASLRPPDEISAFIKDECLNP
jgi:cytochrome c